MFEKLFKYRKHFQKGVIVNISCSKFIQYLFILFSLQNIKSLLFELFNSYVKKVGWG
eukprot:UN27208